MSTELESVHYDISQIHSRPNTVSNQTQEEVSTFKPDPSATQPDSSEYRLSKQRLKMFLIKPRDQNLSVLHTSIISATNA